MTREIYRLGAEYMVSKCKLPNTHNRLNEIHYLLHQTVEKYFSPEEFRIYLNATIQAMRNLTFALQGEKTIFGNGFEEWYKPWQSEMKKDVYMNWLNNSRVQIVHRGDLESQSLIVVRAFAYSDLCVEEHEVPINLSNEDILVFLIDKGYISPLTSFNGIVFEIERKWIEKSLPNDEIIYVLSHCFEFLYRLVYDAHYVIETDVEKCSNTDKLHQYRFEDSRLSCIETSNESRILKFSAIDGSTRSLNEIQVELDEINISEVLKHYNIDKETFSKKSDPTFDNFFEFLCDNAIKILVNDKYHNPMVFIFDSDNNPIFMQLKFTDKSDKYLIMDMIAQKVREMNSTKVFFILESWVSNDIDSYLKYGSLENTSNRKECLTVYGISKNYHNRHLNYIYSRDEVGDIQLLETYESQEKINSFTPIYRVWEN